ncbi:MAG: hypothetical protein WAS49_09520 [Candidatus Dechloromonas phosphoritropha]|nr:hypothetical protein [Candidatus Dechloromonas phosphoritropha]MBP8786039.1 hypothetical protein [Azonexus sp.]MBP9226823.1 hypothetical protein [Azonexus sp.]
MENYLNEYTARMDGKRIILHIHQLATLGDAKCQLLFKITWYHVQTSGLPLPAAVCQVNHKIQAIHGGGLRT